MSGYEKKTQKETYSDISDNHKKHNLLRYPTWLGKISWWDDRRKESKKRKVDSEKLLKGDMTVDKVVPSGGKKVEDIPQQMGSFETKVAGTVMVGYNRFKSSADLGFTVMSEQDKDKEGIPERDKSSPTTYFGANFDGKEKDFEAGVISFRFNKKKEEFEKTEDGNNKSQDGKSETGHTQKGDKKTLLYDYVAEDEASKELQKKKTKNPKENQKIARAKEEIKKIKEKKKEKNGYFLKDIEDFIDMFIDGKLKILVESEDTARQRKRIMELSSKSSETENSEEKDKKEEKDKEEEKKDTQEKKEKKKKREMQSWELLKKLLAIEELKKFLEGIIGKERAKKIAKYLRAKARIKSIGLNEFLELIENIKRKFYLK